MNPGGNSFQTGHDGALARERSIHKLTGAPSDLHLKGNDGADGREGG